jgi:hypothetical protein
VKESGNEGNKQFAIQEAQAVDLGMPRGKYESPNPGDVKDASHYRRNTGKHQSLQHHIHRINFLT